MTVTLSHRSPVGFQLADADTWPNPWPMYSALRDHDPVHHVFPPEKPDHDYWVLSRHADVWEAARDNETFSSAQGLTVNYGELELIGLQDNPPFVMQDPPLHTEFRKLVSRGFTPRQVEAVEPKVREFVVERIERIRGNGGGDIVAELFKPLPSMVVAHYLGVPEEDRNQFDDWTEAIVAANTTSGGVAGALGGLGEMMAYFTALTNGAVASPRMTRFRISSRPASAQTETSRGRCRCWRSRSRWSPAATTPRPECSAALRNCFISGPTSGGFWSRTPT